MFRPGGRHPDPDGGWGSPGNLRRDRFGDGFPLPEALVSRGQAGGADGNHQSGGHEPDYRGQGDGGRRDGGDGQIYFREIEITMKKVVISGGSSGIGKSLVEHFSQAGWKVHFTFHSNEWAAREIENR